MKQRWLLSLFIITMALVLVPASRAQEGIPTDDQVNEVAKKLYCPVCPNTPLDVCETQACKDWRDEIRAQLSAGWDEEEVMAYFVGRYGERVLAEPERRGFTSLIWIMPVVAVLLGLAIVIQALRSWRVQRQQDFPATEDVSATATGNVSPEVRARIEQELEDLL